MRWAKSYSIIDHELLHGGYLHRLRHESIILYLFLVVVGDRDGRSYYAETTVMDILRLGKRELDAARLQLTEEGLIEYRRPYWRVLDIPVRRCHGGATAEDTVSAGRKRA